jgi:hypothetical protein
MELPEALLDRFQVKRINRMNEIDRLPPDIRALVHEFNWTMIKSFLDAGVRDARRIRHLIRNVMDGSAAYGGGNMPDQGVPKLKLSTQTTMELALRDDLAVCHIDPLDQVVQASMDAVLPYVPGTPLLTKREKHRIRLKAALQTAKTLSKL